MTSPRDLWFWGPDAMAAFERTDGRNGVGRAGRGGLEGRRSAQRAEEGEVVEGSTGGPWVLAGCFEVGGRLLRFTHPFHTVPPGSARWWQKWRHEVRDLAFFHCQQAGTRPTFVGVAARNVALGRAFTRELIGSGWAWPRLRRRHHLFMVRAHRVEIRVGDRARLDPGLSRKATDSVLFRAHAALEREEAEASRRHAALARLGGRGGWPEGAPGVDLARAVAVIESGSHRLVVAGALEQAEAEGLARELTAGRRWRPDEHGHAVVWRGHDGLRVLTEHGEGAAADLIRAFAAGFCEVVVVSDLHLGLPHRDSFGREKAAAFCGLLERVIARRSRLVINGDFLELLHERYGAIKRAYPEVMERLRRIRRVVYVAGNHDAGVLREHIKATRRAVRATARQHAFAEVRWALDGGLRLDSHGAGSRCLRQEAAWLDWLEEPRVREPLLEILRRRHGRIFLSRGFPEEGVAFMRHGRRGTAEERPRWFIDESLLGQPNASDRLLRLLADRRQRLDRVIQVDWGDQVEIVSFYEERARGLYFEHGHAAIPACSEGGLGRWVSTAAGWLKRGGLRQIEPWIEEDLGGRLRAIYPFGPRRELHLFIERLLAVGVAFRAVGLGHAEPLLFCGHTHEAAQFGRGPVDALLQQVCGARYGNSGAWSSRFRRRRPGADRGEWLQIAADNAVTVHATVSARSLRDLAAPAPPRARRPAAALTVGG